MKVEDLLKRVSFFTEKCVLERVNSKRKAIVGREESQFFFSRFAEHRALHFALTGNTIGATLREVNLVRNSLFGKCADMSPDVLYAIGCDQRLSGQSLFIIMQHLNIPCLIAYSRYYHKADEQPNIAFVLEEGGCRVYTNIKQSLMAKIVRGRRRESASLKN